jgi:hypothetical protein
MWRAVVCCLLNLVVFEFFLKVYRSVMIWLVAGDCFVLIDLAVMLQFWRL